MITRHLHPCHWMLWDLHEMCEANNPDALAEANRLWDECRDPVVVTALERVQHHLKSGESGHSIGALEGVMYYRDPIAVKAAYNEAMEAMRVPG